MHSDWLKEVLRLETANSSGCFSGQHSNATLKFAITSAVGLLKLEINEEDKKRKDRAAKAE